MKIYFAGSIRGGREEEDTYLKLIEHLGTYGQVLTEHVGKKGIDISEEKNSNEFIYERDIDWLKSCNVMVADVTVPSLGVGYEIAYAESINIPILCLFNTNQKKPLSAMILGNQRLECFNYTNLNEAIAAMDQFFSKEKK
tara:strand:- start:1016 stop:1435 length:420 start_codon:yes stop_codon:yes gene_type:complete